MTLKSFLWDYGEVVPGYDIRVINEREARAAAGILAMLGTIIIFVGIGFNHIMVARIYIGFLWFDFVARVFNPNYSPSLLLGRLFVQNQTPEYVGALQKRFAWTLGWLISFPMVYWFVLQWDITFYKVLICVLCISLMFLESAFSICLGCMIYKFIVKDNPQLCPGGTCEIRTKDPIQMFSPIQKGIVALAITGLLVGTYSFLVKTESKTFFGLFLHDMVLTEAQLAQKKEDAFQRAADKEFGDDDDDF